MRVVLVALGCIGTLLMSGCVGGSTPSASHAKRVGDNFSGPWTLTIVNSAPMFTVPLVATLNTNCIDVSPPYSYTISPGGSASFTPTSINSSGACLFESSYGTITLTDTVGDSYDVVSFSWSDPTYVGISLLYFNCGNYNGMVNKPITSSFTYTFLPSGPPVSYGQCLWNGA